MDFMGCIFVVSLIWVLFCFLISGTCLVICVTEVLKAKHRTPHPHSVIATAPIPANKISPPF